MPNYRTLNSYPEKVKMKKEEKTETVEEKYHKALNYFNRYSHSRRGLHKAIIKALPPLKNENGYDAVAINLAIKAGKIMDLLSEPSRTWNVSVHWLYTVCNPKIKDDSNPKYSPIYEKHATQLPLNRFGELDHIVEDGGAFIRIGDKLVGDDRFVGKGCEDFGSAWNENGEVIKRDSNGHPSLDGFADYVAQHVDTLQHLCCQNSKRDRHFAAFLIFHTRDDQVNERDDEVEHKESHCHAVIDMPTRRTRYRMMELMGFNFDDFAETFRWISQMNAQQRIIRIEAFLATLQGAMQNYIVTKNFVSSLQYLVHQSKKAKQSQKTPYSVSEVLSWLPDDPGKTYSSIAGVYDDEVVAEGINSGILRNLHSPFNVAHHTTRLVGRNDGDRVFSYHQLAKLRNLGAKGTGHMTFSKRSKKMIQDQLMKWIYQGRMEVSDWQDAIHGAFADEDAASLIADQDFTNKLNAVLDEQRAATIKDVDADRKMTTIFISAAQGGIGKTYLANRLCQYCEKGRTPYVTAAEDKNKTVDFWQDYEDQASAVIDEISASSVEWSALKDMLDPHKIPRVSSRFHNTSPWNVNLLILTNVFTDGVAGYVRGVLHYAPGVAKLGYLERDENSKRDWKMKANDSEAGQVYLSQLSQILRRLPINIHMSTANNGKGTKVLVSIINFRPGGRSLRSYDYVYTKESVHIFNTVINDDLAEAELDKIVIKVAQMIRNLKSKAQAVFKDDPTAILNEENGFLSRHLNFGFYIQDGQPLLREDDKQKEKREPVNVSISPSVNENLLTKLNYLRYELWPEIDVASTNFAPNENQLTALLQGKSVPIRHGVGNQWVTLLLTKKALNLAQNGQVMPIIMRLNKVKTIEKDDDFFLLGQTNQVAHLLPNLTQSEG
jgi:hypothetical protein